VTLRELFLTVAVFVICAVIVFRLACTRSPHAEHGDVRPARQTPAGPWSRSFTGGVYVHYLGRLLTGLGAYGPILLVASLAAGGLNARLSHGGYVLLPASAFLLTLGSFLSAGLASFEMKMRPSHLVVVLAWLGIGIPIAAAAALSLVPLDPSLRTGALLSLLAPPVGSAAAIAAMLDLQPRLALVVSIALTAVAPFSMPLLGRVLDLQLQMEMTSLAVRLIAIIGAAALIAFASLRFRNVLKPLLPDQRAGTGVAVIGLIIVGLATAQGVRTYWTQDPLAFERMLAAAFAVNIGTCAIGAAVFAWLGPRAATTVGLVSGNRNVTLAWAAAGFGLPPLAEGYVAACVVPVLALPLLVKLCLALSSACSRAVMKAREQP
jgi:ACR3 family arsenite transporter